MSVSYPKRNARRGVGSSVCPGAEFGLTSNSIWSLGCSVCRQVLRGTVTLYFAFLGPRSLTLA